MKRKISAALAAALLLTGCTAPGSSESTPEPFAETTETTTATVTTMTTPDLSRFTLSSTTSTTADTETETTGTGTTLSGESSAAETTITAIPQGAVKYRISGIITAEFYCLKPPESCCAVREGKSILELRRAAEPTGFRRDGESNDRWQYKKDEQTAVIEIGSRIALDASTLYLDELRYSCGDKNVIISQRSPRKVQHYLEDGTGITGDQLALIVYLTEQLSKNPALDPLADLIPQYLTDNIDGTVWYYLP